MAFNPKQQLHGGRYTIEKELGRGRFGITYLARDRNGDGVLIKTLNDALLTGPDFDRWQQNFVKEAFKLARCRHPNIVQAEEPFQEGGLWCIPMEYVDGVDLASRAHNRLPEEDALHYIKQIGEALTVVHSQGLLHRDVKPANIMVRVRNGKSEAVLIDFGLAREFDHELTQTRPEEMAEGFSAPELYSRTAKRGPYTDVYSLAATLYVLLTGKLPTSAIDRKLSNISLIPPKDINPQICDRVNQAIIDGMKLDPDARPQTMQAWLNLLELPSVGSSSVPKSVDKSSPQDWNKVAALAAVIGIVIAVIAAIPGWMPVMERFFQPSPKLSPTATPNSQATPPETPLPQK
ncbi:serine/threonine protein kinase [Argonema galeatum]|uniref:serine/threonine protein kinase n=1 Tax=Argonema galeatum TaxID=2942762 RepID=UPI002012A548|nr:serine/threonine-protein kinase [Argonema galeatum]MCL1465635.1 serine/threonine protein kinase [Argonema galeatum A003/A1]